MTGVVDFHTHAFPDALADRAIGVLQEQGGIKAHRDGRISSLLASMDDAGIERSVVCSIATKESQFDSIFAWSKKIRSERIEPFPSFHPRDPHYARRIERIRGDGFAGIKFHPYYQDFTIDDETFFPLYESCARSHLLVVFHTGFDFAFPFVDRAGPGRVARIARKFPEMRIVTTHMGGWKQWEEVERVLLGGAVFMEISFSLEFVERDRARRILLGHPPDRILFGTDSPWTDQAETMERLRALVPGEERLKKILRENALRLLAHD